MDPTLALQLFGVEGVSGLLDSSVSPVAAEGGVPTVVEPTVAAVPATVAPTEAYRTQPAVAVGAQPASSLGAVLEPTAATVPVPTPRPAAAVAADPSSQTNKVATAGSNLLKTLQGVTAPTAATQQKISTPNAAAPQTKAVKSGSFVDLLSSLGIGPQQLTSGMKLPSTLGQALGGK